MPASDGDGDAIAKYQLWDSTADPASGHWLVNGTAQGANQAIDVTAAQLAQTSFQSGSGSDTVYVRAFDSGKPEAPPPGTPAKVSKDGTVGMITWRQDGKELYFLSRDWEVMAVDISTTPTLTVGTPMVLFKMPGPLPGNPLQWKNVSKDGHRFIFSMPTGGGAAPTR